jgi:hypothetical protein
VPVPGGSAKETPLKALVDTATSNGWVRNSVGCHFNVSAGGIPDAEVKGFGVAVLALANALMCPNCRTLPTRRPSGTFWQCQCPKEGLQLYPLVAPGADPSTVDDES